MPGWCPIWTKWCSWVSLLTFHTSCHPQLTSFSARWVKTIVFDILNHMLLFQMIGTTSDMESNAEVLYPSFTMCSRRENFAYRPTYNMTAIRHKSVNLSNTFLRLELYVRNDDGKVEKVIMEPDNVDSKVVYGYFALYPDPIIKNGTGMAVSMTVNLNANLFLHIISCRFMNVSLWIHLAKLHPESSDI